jgi:hypothetical protein
MIDVHADERMCAILIPERHGPQLHAIAFISFTAANHNKGSHEKALYQIFFSSNRLLHCFGVLFAVEKFVHFVR